MAKEKNLAFEKARREKGMTQQELADATNVSRMWINKIENGAVPSLVFAKHLAKVLGVKVDDLF